MVFVCVIRTITFGIVQQSNANTEKHRLAYVAQLLANVQLILDVHLHLHCGTLVLLGACVDLRFGSIQIKVFVNQESIQEHFVLMIMSVSTEPIVRQQQKNVYVTHHFIIIMDNVTQKIQLIKVVA